MRKKNANSKRTSFTDEIFSYFHHNFTSQQMVLFSISNENKFYFYLASICFHLPFFSNSSICHFKSYTHSVDKLFFVFPLLFRFYFVVRLSSLWYDRRAQINQRRKRYWLGRSFFIVFLLQNDDDDDDNSNKSNIRFSNNNTEQFNISTCIFNFFL